LPHPIRGRRGHGWQVFAQLGAGEGECSGAARGQGTAGVPAGVRDRDLLVAATFFVPMFATGAFEHMDRNDPMRPILYLW
jgi:hypothetical protein